MMSGWMTSGWGIGYGPFGWLMMMVLWGVIIGAAILAVRWLTSQDDGRGPGHRSALELLKERYASGEIDREEFEAMKRDLS